MTLNNEKTNHFSRGEYGTNRFAGREDWGRKLEQIQTNEANNIFPRIQFADSAAYTGGDS